MEVDTKPVSKLIHTIDSCMQYFEKCEKYKELCDKLDSFKSNVDNCYEKVKIIESFASEYDFDENTPSNGYRSFVSIFASAIKKSLNLCHQMSKSRMKILFRANYYAKYKVSFS